MRHMFLAMLAAISLTTTLSDARADDCDCGRPSCTTCTDAAGCGPCVPACKSSWDEKKTKLPAYTMKCEFACARSYECFCTDPTECRCSPPCGDVYRKKKLYKADGEEKVEKVPKYEVTMVPAEPCECACCRGVCWWDPLSVLHYLLGR